MPGIQFAHLFDGQVSAYKTSDCRMVIYHNVTALKFSMNHYSLLANWCWLDSWVDELRPLSVYSVASSIRYIDLVMHIAGNIIVACDGFKYFIICACLPVTSNSV